MFMSNDRFYITKSGLEKLQKIKNVYTESKPFLAQKVNKAKSHGDLRENSEYTIALEAQQLANNQEKVYSDLIQNTIVIENFDNVDKNKVVFGAHVFFKNLSTGNEENYILVSDFESDIDHQLISIKSPLGKELLGKRLNDTFEFNDEEFSILQIVYNIEKINEIIEELAKTDLEILNKSLKDSN